MKTSPSVAQIGLRGVSSSSIGGIETVVRILVGGLESSKVRSTVYIRDRRVDDVEGLIGITIVNIPSVKIQSVDTLFYSFISTIYACKHDDIIHYHGVGPAIFSWIPRLFGRKVVVTVHALDWNREKWGYLAACILKCGALVSVKCANIITAVSPPIKMYFQETYNRETLLVPNGIAIESSEDFVSTQRIDGDVGYFLFIGRLVPEKRCHDLIAAFLSCDLRARLLIVGDLSIGRDYCLRLQEMCRNAENIEFIGPKYGREKAELIKGAIAVVLPSAVEGHPLVILEAMALRKAVICSDIEENKFAVGTTENSRPSERNAIIFRTGDIDSLGKALMYAMGDRSRLEDIARRGFEWICTHFAADKMIDGYLGIYRHLASTKV